MGLGELGTDDFWASMSHQSQGLGQLYQEGHWVYVVIVDFLNVCSQVRKVH